MRLVGQLAPLNDATASEVEVEVGGESDVTSCCSVDIVDLLTSHTRAKHVSPLRRRFHLAPWYAREGYTTSRPNPTTVSLT